MKTLNLLAAALFFLSVNYSCTGQSDQGKNTEAVSEAGDVEMYYFHYTRRCVTCNSVEEVTAQTLNENFGKNIPFISYNLDEPEGKKRAQELGVSGQTLLLVKGDTKINLTNEGFMYARSSPDKLKTILLEKIATLI